MPFINVKLLEGRTIEQKKKFIKAITEDAVNILKCKPEALTIIFEEYSPNDWSIGGKLLSEKE